MITIQNVPVKQDLIDSLVSMTEGCSVEDLTVVFPGKRPSFHFRDRLTQRYRRPFRPPRIFSMQEYLLHLSGLKEPVLLDEIDSVFFLKEIIDEYDEPSFRDLASDREIFFPWGLELIRSIDELMRERVSDLLMDQLRLFPGLNEVNTNIRLFYEKLPEIAGRYRNKLTEIGRVTHGMVPDIILRNPETLKQRVTDQTILAGLFAFSRGEQEVIREVGKISQVVLVRHHDGRTWKAFSNMDRLVSSVSPPPDKTDLPDIRILSAPNAHGEVLALASIIREQTADLSNTAIVIPDPGRLLPVLWEVMTRLDTDFNITMGYPVVRTPVYALINQILRVIESGKNERYSTKEYLSLLFHPYVISFRMDGMSADSTRAVIHSVEEFLKKAGHAVISLDDIESNRDLLTIAADRAGTECSETDIQNGINRLHSLMIRQVESFNSLRQLSDALRKVLSEVAEHSQAVEYPFFNEYFTRSSDILESITDLLMSEEPIDDIHEGIWSIRRVFESSVIPFNGLPVTGLQVLGLLETRALNFDQVYVLDVNESVLPALTRHDPILPPAIRSHLGLPGYREVTELYQYHLYRLIESSGQATLIYRDAPDTQRSHFLEQLIFELELKNGRAEAGEPAILNFRGECAPKTVRPVMKTPGILARIRSVIYSAHSLDTYVKCPMSFFYEKILNLQNRQVLSKEMDPRQIGIMLHEVMRKLYEPHRGYPFSRDLFKKLKLELTAVLDQVFPDHGEQRLIRKMAERRIVSLIEREENMLTDWKLLGVEEKMESTLTIGKRYLRCKSYLDRLDLREGSLFIVDYKTGRDLKRYYPDVAPVPIQLERRAIQKRLNSFQIPLYVEMVRYKYHQSSDEIGFGLISLTTLNIETIQLNDSFMNLVFLPALEHIVDEIENPDIPFVPDPLDSDLCSECPYSALCGKSVLASHDIEE